MSDPTFSDIDFKNKMVWVWTSLKYKEKYFQDNKKRQIRGRGMGQNGSKASSVFSTMFQVKKDHLESDDKLSFPASITRFIPRSPSMSGSSFRTCDAASTVVKLNIKNTQIFLKSSFNSRGKWRFKRHSVLECAITVFLAPRTTRPVLRTSDRDNI